MQTLQRLHFSLWLWAGIIVAIVGAGLFIAQPFVQVYLTAIGNILMFIGACMILYGITRLPITPEGTMTFGEKRSILGVVSNTLLVAYILYHIAFIGWMFNSDRDNTGPYHLIIILGSIAPYLLLKREGGRVTEDERDRAIRQRALEIGSSILVILLILGSFALIQVPTAWSAILSPIAIGHTLLILLLCIVIIAYSTQVWLYRRDRL